MGMVWMGFRREESVARGVLADPDALDELLESDDDTCVDLDKAWHALQWLLGRGDGAAAQTAADAILGGEAVGENRGYGPGRLLSAQRVQAVAQALALTDRDALRSRMDPAALEAAEVYPMIWDEGDVFDSYLAPAYDQLRDFYAAAADADQAVVQVLC